MQFFRFSKNRTQQIFLTGTAQTYTRPSGCNFLMVRMVGGGGGGAGGGSGSPGSGGNGGNTTFGTSLLVANGSTGGNATSGLGGAGGGACHAGGGARCRALRVPLGVRADAAAAGAAAGPAGGQADPAVQVPGGFLIYSPFATIPCHPEFIMALIAIPRRRH